MENVLGYVIFDAVSESWLQDDEKSWGGYNGAAMFYSDAKLAQDIGERENPNDEKTIFVMAVMGTI